MSLHVLADHMATKGRGSDSMLVHMTPEEVASLQALAMKNGGSLTINPDTGLPEAGFLKKLLPAIAGFALNAFAPGIGSAIGGALGLGTTAAAGAIGTGIAVGGVTGLATGSLSKGLMAGLGAYGGAGLASSVMGAGASAGLESALANAGTAEGAQGQAFNEFLKSEANPAVMSGADKLSAGFNAVKEAPGAFLKDNWKMGLAAASPFIADAMVPTTVKAPDAPKGYIRPFQFDENTRTVRAMDPVLASEWGARSFPDYIRKGQTAPPAGMAPQLPPGMARGGIVALAEGGDAGAAAPVDPYARFNTLSGQSKDAYDYLMGNIQRVPAADLTTPTRPMVPNTNTTPTTGGGGDGGTGPVEPPATFLPPTYTEPVLPSPDEDFPSTYKEPVMPSPDEDFPSTYPAPVPAPADDDELGYLTGNKPEPYVSDPYNPDPVYREPFVPEPAPEREPVDKSYWDDVIREEVGPSRGLMKNQEELPEEFDKYLQPEPAPSDFIPANPSDFGAVDDTGGAGTIGGGSGRFIEVDENLDEDYYDYMGMASGGMVPGYADGGVSGSGSLDLHVPINLGSGAGGGMGGGMGGGFNGGYTPAGSNGSAGNMNPNTGGNGFGGMPGGLAGLLGGGFDPRAIAGNPQGFEQYMGQMQQREQQMPGSTMLAGMGGTAENGFMSPGGRGGYNPFSAKLPELNLIDDRTDAQKAEAERFAAANPSVRGLANGGMVPGYALGGLGALGGYSDGGRLLKGPGDGVSDSIPATIGKKQSPARLADGEFVIPARIVSELGNGSTEAGARKLYAMMDRVQKARGKTVGKGKVAANSRSDKHLPA